MDHKRAYIPEDKQTGQHRGHSAGRMLRDLGQVLGLSEPHFVSTWAVKYMDLIAP